MKKNKKGVPLSYFTGNGEKESLEVLSRIDDVSTLDRILWINSCYKYSGLIIPLSFRSGSSDIPEGLCDISHKKSSLKIMSCRSSILSPMIPTKTFLIGFDTTLEE